MRKVKVPTPLIQKVPIVRRVQAVVKTKVLPAETLVLRSAEGLLGGAAAVSMRSAYANQDLNAEALMNMQETMGTGEVEDVEAS